MKPAKFIASGSLVLTITSVVAALAQQTPGAQLGAPNADACDRLVASPYDKARPTDVQGVPFEQVDAPAAIEACRAAVAGRPDDVRLAFQLARALQKDGGAEALTEAVRLYRFAADRGHVGAQYNLGAFYANGRGGLPKNDEEAVRIYRLTADQGLALAYSALGSYHETGRGGLPKDQHEAARLYRRAADQGFAFAQTRLGFFYEAGRGGLRKNVEEAARHLPKATRANESWRHVAKQLHDAPRGGDIRNVEASLWIVMTSERLDVSAVTTPHFAGGRLAA